MRKSLYEMKMDKEYNEWPCRQLDKLVPFLKDCRHLNNTDRLEFLCNNMDYLIQQFDINKCVYNLFFAILNEMRLDPTMETYHEYYIKLVNESKLTPDIVTFNVLLKATRLSEPSKYAFARYFKNEMHRYNIQYDTFTINEILLMSVKHPEKESNLQAADNFFAYYLQNLFRIDKNPGRIFHSYLAVFAQAGYRSKARYIYHLACSYGIHYEPLIKTYSSFIQLWQQDTNHHWQ